MKRALTKSALRKVPTPFFNKGTCIKGEMQKLSNFDTIDRISLSSDEREVEGFFFEKLRGYIINWAAAYKN